MSDDGGKLAIFKQPTTWIILAVVFVLIGIAGVGIYQYTKVTKELSTMKTSSNGPLTDDRQRELIAEVSSRIMLPGDEKPTVAVVSDINRLKDQQFFANGQNGDVVLIYMTSKKAVLYRPTDKKIVEVAPVNLNNTQASVAGTTTASVDTNPTPATSTAPTPTPAPRKYSILNGTSVTGLAKTFEQQLTTKFPTAQVLERGNAVKRDYATSTLVDVGGNKTAEAQQVASALGIVPGPLPAGEQLPAGVDFLIIIGADKK